MYSKLNKLPNKFVTVKNNQLKNPVADLGGSGKTILKNGFVVDPRNNIEEVKDIVIVKDKIVEVGNDIKSEKGDIEINCEGLLVVPGLVDMHLHLGDLFEVTTNPIFTAVSDGVTMGLSPGAGNTFMAPALLGAEVDRGLPINIGVYLGAPTVLNTLLSHEELISFFKGELDPEIAGTKMTRNSIANTMAAMIIGLKDHMGHYILPDEDYDRIFDITEKAQLVYMTHTQDPDHAERLVELSKGRHIHLAHLTAAGCGTHGDAVESFNRVLDLVKNEHVSAEFVTSHLRRSGGNRDALMMPKETRMIAYDKLADGTVNIINSDGQSQSTMKGFGDTRDNIPALLELVEMEVLTLSESIATMTANPTKYIAERSGNEWWINEVGHLGVDALANVTIIDQAKQTAAYTIVNGEITAFESRIVRRGNGAGGFVSKHGMVRNTGVGDTALSSYID